MGTPQSGDKESVPGGFHSSSGPQALPSFGCSKFGFSRRACSVTQRLCAFAGATGSPGPSGGAGPLAGTSSQLPQPRRLQPLAPGLLRLPGYDTSTGHQGLSGIDSAFLFLLNILI